MSDSGKITINNETGVYGTLQNVKSNSKPVEVAFKQEVEHGKATILTTIGIPHIEGKTWTTDAFYRETKEGFEQRKAEGCIAVDMECSAIQAVCNWREKQLYYILFSGDLLDCPEWIDDGLDQANHSLTNFNIALHLAEKI